ncbi:AAA family ATPase [Runella sp.]|uniref:AAA family ATPase n=1 Tax=Runella sp. TaxID=1960881 RepID=UPI003D0F2EA2
MTSLLDKFKTFNQYNEGQGPETTPVKTAKPSYLPRLREVQKMIEVRACQDIQFARPLLSLGESGIIYPNTITVIQGQKGSHKSRLTENIGAAFLCMNPQLKFLGFTITPLMRFHLAYIDSERNQKDQFPYAVQRIKEKAGFDKTALPSNFDVASLIDIDRAERFEAISQYLEEMRQNHPNEHIIVVIDVITDCIGSFNDPKESMKLIDMLNQMINLYNVSFICVIHENPNSFGESKARGHLGTELINKASTVISIGFDKGSNGNSTDLIVVKFLHTRSIKKPEPHFLHYSEEAKGLVVAEGDFITEQKNLKAEKAELGELRDWLTENLMGEVSKAELVNQLADYFGCTSKTIDTRLKGLTEGLHPFLTRLKKGKEVYFHLSVPF